MKHKAPQFELPQAEEVFNLQGERAKLPPPVETEPLVDENHNPTLGLTFDGEASYENQET